MSRSMIIPLADSNTLNAKVDGPDDAPWIVLSNSVMTDLHIWDTQVAALSTQFQVLRYDQRGHGESSVPDGQMDFTTYGADLLAVLDACKVDRCAFVGLSMGVPTGLVALANAPDRFAAFVAVDGVSKSAAGREGFWTERRETARSEGMARIASETTPRWLPNEPETSVVARSLRDMITAIPVEGFASATYALQSYDHTDALNNLNCPFLGIAGEQDGAIPQAMRAQFGNLPNATFAEIPGAGHVPNFQKPDSFTSALLGFLNAQTSLIRKEAI
ncbi:alpha/beta fold hydrolase [Phaeobacter sp. C3_T13_0]|uniref:alpha/beta fold hydrolase n=1 Tax=Phaeobacter cretensis TaxID=3342641 RepID=UPI0039BD1FD3